MWGDEDLEKGKGEGEGEGGGRNMVMMMIRRKWRTSRNHECGGIVDIMKVRFPSELIVFFIILLFISASL